MEVVLVQLLEGLKGEETGARVGNDTHHSGPHPSVQPPYPLGAKDGHESMYESMWPGEEREKGGGERQREREDEEGERRKGERGGEEEDKEGVKGGER